MRDRLRSFQQTLMAWVMLYPLGDRLPVARLLFPGLSTNRPTAHAIWPSLVSEQRLRARPFQPAQILPVHCATVPGYPTIPRAVDPLLQRALARPRRALCVYLQVESTEVTRYDSIAGVESFCLF